jgi:hypothetical protein
VDTYFSMNSWRGPGVPEFSVSGKIFQLLDCTNVSESDFLSCCQHPGGHSLVFAN